MKGSRFTEEPIIEILKEAEAGLKVAEACRKYGMSQWTLYAWRKKYQGLTVPEVRRGPVKGRGSLGGQGSGGWPPGAVSLPGSTPLPARRRKGREPAATTTIAASCDHHQHQGREQQTLGRGAGTGVVRGATWCDGRTICKHGLRVGHLIQHPIWGRRNEGRLAGK